MVRRFISSALFTVGLLTSLQVAALNPDIRLQDLNHVSWSEKDGVPADIRSMAQTRDGWLWLATSDGLYRFDGVRFEKRPLPRQRLYNLHAMDNGDLLITYALEGLSRLTPDGKLTELIDPKVNSLGNIDSLAVDREGAIWAASIEGLHRYRDGKWETLSSGPDWKSRSSSLLVDQHGRVWAANDRSVFMYDRVGKQLQRMPGGDVHGSLIQSPDGRLWLADYDKVQLVPAPFPGEQAPRNPDVNQVQSRWGGLFDREGNLWALKCPYGVCRVSRAGAMHKSAFVPSRDADDLLNQHWQLSALSTNVILEDREGNIWISTQSGLERFRENKLIPARIPGPNGVYSMASDTEGKLWVAEFANRAIWHVGADGPPVRDPARSGAVLAKDRDGALLIAGTRAIERIYQGQSSHIALPLAADGQAQDHVVVGMLDDGKVLWMASYQSGLMGMVDGKWLPAASFNLPKRIFLSAAGDIGQLWLSHNDGSLTLYDNERLSKFDIRMVGEESGIFPGPQLVVGGQQGLAVLLGKQFVQFAPHDADPLRNVTGMAITADGDRWLNGGKGVVHIRSADWQASINQPSLPLKYEVIDVLDGYPGRAAFDNRLPTVYNSGDGRLWFRATGGLVRLETAQLRPNAIRPSVQLISVATDDATYRLNTPVGLPPGSSKLTFEYTAPGLRKPEGMRFEYRLQGLDRDWQPAGTRRVAYYTNVAPGRYTFSVRAVNEDGVVSDSVGTQQIDIAPTVLQTWWFQLICLLAVLAALYGLYRYRVNAATAAVARQMQTRVDERERIARTLHDTFLQSVQAMILRVSSVLQKLPQDSEPRRQLETILDQADRVINEGREQVQDLRRGQQIELALAEAGNVLAAVHADTAFELTVTGTRRDLSPPVQEELSEIGQEALRNAFTHAQARKVCARIDYATDAFSVHISDDGRGLEPQEVKKKQSENHWGLTGMGERAKRIGAEFDMRSKPGAGTTITARIAARVAYERA